MKGFGPYASAKVPDGKYLWTVVVLFSLLGLTGLGALVYRPLRIRFIISRLRSEDPINGIMSSRHRYADRLNECCEAALAGNREARLFVLEQASGRGAAVWPELFDRMVFALAASDTMSFTTTLDLLPDARAGHLLAVLEKAARLYHLYGDTYDVMDEPLVEGPKALVEALEAIAEGRLPDALPSPKISPTAEKQSEARRVAQAALDFTRRRFARELAEANKSAEKSGGSE